MVCNNSLKLNVKCYFSVIFQPWYFFSVTSESSCLRPLALHTSGSPAYCQAIWLTLLMQSNCHNILMYHLFSYQPIFHCVSSKKIISDTFIWPLMKIQWFITCFTISIKINLINLRCVVMLISLWNESIYGEAGGSTNVLSSYTLDVTMTVINTNKLNLSMSIAPLIYIKL